MRDTADIVIIGAGIVGCSLAYHLTLHGIPRVVVLEKDLICSGSTGRSAGGIRQQFAAELILTGATSIDISPFRIERFRTGRVVVESMTAHQT
jgi:glycine/D-amino acid oxidase-like deaminating enzyme